MDILDDSIRTPEWFWNVSGIFRSTGRLPEPPGGNMGHMGLGREAHQPTRGWLTPHKEGGRIGVGKGAAPPFPSPTPSAIPFSLSEEGKKGEPNPTRTGVLVGLPSPWRTPGGWPPPLLLYIWGQGGTQKHN